MSILVGANFYAAGGEEARRQAAAIAALRALTGVQTVNVQWPDEAYEVVGVPTLARLRSDSRMVSGRNGRRKPIVSEILHVLADAAAACGCAHFMFANADIEITQAAIEMVRQDPRDGFVLARTDIEPDTGGALGVMRYGSDAFVFDARWWQRHRHRFRAYIVGEPVWDNVYTAILLTHSNAVFVDREGLILHPRHGSGPWGGPFAGYTRLLAALDRPYFSLWAEFNAGLIGLAGSPEREAAAKALRTRVFNAGRLRHGRLLQSARALKARLRYAWQGRRA